jgi:hypothetical protein
MPAPLVPNEAIPELAAGIDSPLMLRVLRRIHQVGFILNGKDVDQETVRVLQRLTELGLVDPGYDGRTGWPPFQWVINGNGSRVLRYLASIPAGPHYEIPSSELAAWLEQQGKDRWWYVDGDPLLTGRLALPCPADELAVELRKINRPMLVQAKNGDSVAKGQPIGRDKLSELVAHFADNVPGSGSEQMSLCPRDRLLYMRWKGSPHEWLLCEDSQTTDLMRADDLSKAK